MSANIFDNYQLQKDYERQRCWMSPRKLTKLSKILKETIRHISPGYYRFQSKPSKLVKCLLPTGNPTGFTQASSIDIQSMALKEHTAGQIRATHASWLLFTYPRQP